MLQVLQGFGHGFGLAAHFGHRSGAFMQLIASAVDCNKLHGCPHCTHGFGHGAHGFAASLSAASAGSVNIAATATTNANTANFLITTPPSELLLFPVLIIRLAVQNTSFF